MPDLRWEQFDRTIVHCRKCPRLSGYIRRVADKKMRRFKDQPQVKAILTPGGIAFNRYCRLTGLKGLRFGRYKVFHNATALLISSYHPIRQNTNTGKLRWVQWLQVFRHIRSLLAEGAS